jgi:putrescine---pyruvate transaminase
MICFAKGVTSGYLPLGGVVASERVSEPFWRSDGPVFRHGATYAGHAACCAAALANLEILEREGLLERGREMEGKLLEALMPLASHPLVGEVRGGVGTMAAVELAGDVLADDLHPVAFLAASARASGVLIRPLGHGVAVSPPLTATSEHFDLIAATIADALDALAGVRADRHAARA